MPPLPVVEPEVKMSSVEIQAVFPLVATAEEPPKKRRRSSGSATGKGTDYTYTKKTSIKKLICFHSSNVSGVSSIPRSHW